MFYVPEFDWLLTMDLIISQIVFIFTRMEQSIIDFQCVKLLFELGILFFYSF